MKRSAFKNKSPKTSKIRQSAKNEDCTLQIDGVCSYDPSTVVLCHRNGAGIGMKSDDTDACYGCYSCHMVLDGQHKRPEWLTKGILDRMFFDAREKTQAILKRKGLM